MSQATKRKHVVKEVLGDFVTPTENQQIVKGETFLVSMPTKFRKNIWIKRGDYVIVDPIEEGEKVKAEISFILYKDHIQYLQKQQLWPESFKEEQQAQDTTNKRQDKDEKDEAEDVSDSEDDESDLFVNTNRCNYQYIESEEEDSEDEDEDEEKRTENGS
ncbi:probable RNA-binding protein EIF1AD [Scomber scombrus]|uniref:Probable RNA-binding protein EIF1AD n=1 Tax=Scomber scombrus TaxID=13677 RepID=A0AAV1PY48_SCOSC